MTHEIEELSPEASAFLDEVRGADDPTSADRARVKRALLATVAGGVAASAAATTSTAAASATTAAGTTAVGTAAIGSSFSVAAKLAAVVIAIGTVGTAAVVVPGLVEPSMPAVEQTAPEPASEEPLHAPTPAVAEAAPAPEPEPVVEAEVEAEAEAEAEPVAETLPVIAETQTRRARRTPVTPAAEPVAEPAPVASTLAAENTLLRRAQRAISQGEPEAALRHLGAHASRFPQGMLTEEREAARVVALCDAGRQAEARALAARFLAERPASPLAARVRAACP